MFAQIIEGLLLVSGFWVVAVLLLTFPWIQRHLFYLHRLPIWLGQQLGKPETYGYLHNQVVPFEVTSSDGDQLYAWLIIPLNKYLKHESELQRQRGNHEVREKALELLADDSNNKLVVYFHGNAGTVGQTGRTEAYRSISAGNSDHIFVLAFDYRGFGYSPGQPTEYGLISDAITVVQ